MADENNHILKAPSFKTGSAPVGLLDHDDDALTNEQKKYVKDQEWDIRKKNEKYLTQHPEIDVLVDIYLEMIITTKPRCNLKQITAVHFSRPKDIIEKEVNDRLKEQEGSSFRLSTMHEDITAEGTLDVKETDQWNLKEGSAELALHDLENVKERRATIVSQSAVSQQSEKPLSIHEDSSFLSLMTSNATAKTVHSEISEPQSTFSLWIFNLYDEIADKAIYSSYKNADIIADCAKVILQSLMEKAMEINVIPIRLAIDEMFTKVFTKVENITIQRELDIRRKIPKTYEKKMKILPTFNRYPKDSFGIYSSSEKADEEPVIDFMKNSFLYFTKKKYIPEATIKMSKDATENSEFLEHESKPETL